MLYIHKSHVAQLRERPTVDGVAAALTTAVQLELSTVPPYLTALFSIKHGTNRLAGALVQSVVMEEMLHMTLAANTLIAIGGNPDIVAAGAGLAYPGPLPLLVDDGLVVSLGALTPAQVALFMAIERPDSTDILPGETTPSTPPAVPGEYASIGDFYRAIMQALAALGEAVFAAPRLEQQVDIGKWFPPVPSAPAMGKVNSVATAVMALQTIADQGEGVAVGPRYHPGDSDGKFAHYFRFGEIFHGRRLRPDELAPSGWSYTGDEVPLQEGDVHQLLANGAVDDYEPGSAAFIGGEQFYLTYQRLLASLNQVFNGKPQALDAALGIMYELKLVAEKVVQHPAGRDFPHAVAAPPFMRTRGAR